MSRVLKSIAAVGRLLWARPFRATGLRSTTSQSWLIAGVFQLTVLGIAAAYHLPSFSVPLYLLSSSRLGVVELSMAEPLDQPLVLREFEPGSPIPTTDVLVAPGKASIGRRQFVRSSSPRTAVALAELRQPRSTQDQPLLAQRPTSPEHQELNRSADPHRENRRPSRAATRFISVPMATAPRHLVSWAPGWSSNRPPEYPATARQKRWEGVVELSVTITATGRVSDVEITQSSGHAVLDGAAVGAVRAWRVAPAMMGGQAVPITTPLRVRFELP